LNPSNSGNQRFKRERFTGSGIPWIYIFPDMSSVLDGGGTQQTLFQACMALADKVVRF
jgi:hypothetical protein